MNEMENIQETFAFFSVRKEQETLQTVFTAILALPVDQVSVEFPNRPDEQFKHINDRSRKILMSLPSQQKISRISGDFSDGGSFSLHGSTLLITLSSDQYNFEVSDTMRKVLSPVFPLCIFRNPYIWGIDLYLPYERQTLFDTRNYIVRSQLLEDPQIDIFRRDDGIIFKLRFHLAGDHEFEEGMRLLHALFEEIHETLAKGSYEPLELLHLYCADRRQYRSFSPRTKLGNRFKAIIADT
ncbi:MAG TPA: hypothetical protein PKO06_15115 [Candidatus Ozemobacteraceae bacterium]|nr:hypothetical protein [Candidatus Ozemobacteraceae bacterium]